MPITSKRISKSEASNIQEASQDENSEMTEYQSLWRAVIAQAL